MTLHTDAPAETGVVSARAQELIDRIDAIADELESEGPPSEELGKLTERAIELLNSTGVSGAFLAEELGGVGMYPGEALPALERVAYIDGSIGWVNTIFASAGHMLGYVSKETGLELLAKGQPLFGAVSNGAGKAVPVEGGFRVSGKYRYASGSLHADYMFVPAMLVVDGEPVQGPAGNATYLVPTSEIDFGEGWDTIGLRATGSVDFSFSDVFVPADHVLDMFGPSKVGGREAGGGMLLLIQLMHLGFATGITRRIIDEMSKYANTPPSRPGAPLLAESPRFRIEFAEHDLAARAAKLLVSDVLADVDATLRAGEPVSRHQIAMVMGASVHMHNVARDVAQWAFRRGGGVALRNGTLQRAIRDAMAGTQHFICDDSHLNDVGFELLGAPDNYVWLGFELGPIPEGMPGH